ncbi:unnamed protein product, partial [Closterium sp. NIES-54]
VAGWILELDRGHGIPFEGNYSAWLENKAQRLGAEEKQQSALQRVMEREMEWIRQKAKGQQKKGKARMRAYEELVIQAGQYSREERLESMFLPPGPRLGDVVVEAEGVAKAFGERVLMDGVNFTLPPGGIVGVIGGNGAGKSTLFRMIVGQDSPNEGTLRVGDTVAPLYVDQSRDTLDPNKTVFEEITGGADEILLGERKVNSRAYCAWYNFKGADQQKKVGVLSGGERNRVHLARIMRRGGNLLMLDEPTNDLDVDTLRALEDAIQGFAGCVIVISHDRWFLDRIATHIMAFEGDSKVRHLTFFWKHCENPDITFIIHFITFIIPFITFIIHFITFIIHFITFIIPFITFIIHFITFIIHFITFIIHFITFIIHFITFIACFVTYFIV